MTCAECLERLEDRLDGLLPGPERSALERHLAACPACAAEARSLECLEGLLRTSLGPPAVTPPAEALARLLPRPSLSLSARAWIAAAAVLLAWWTAADGLREDGGRPAPRSARAQGPRPAQTTLPTPDPAPDRTPSEVEPEEPAERTPVIDWLARLRTLADTPPAERAPQVAAWVATRADWEPVYVEALRTRAPHANAAWIALAPELGVETARPALRRLLSDPGRRPAALLALARMRDTAATAAACAALRDPAERTLGLEALALAEPERALPVLLDAAQDETLAEPALRLLAGMGDRADAELARRLASRDRDVVRGALDTTARLGRGPLAAAVQALLSSPALRPDAVATLLALRRPESVAPLLECMDDPDAADEVAAGLGAFGDAGQARLRELLRSPLSRLRARAAEALGFTADRRAVPALCAALADPAVRPAAIVALGRLGDPAAIRPLQHLLADPAQAEAAVAAIASIGGDAALEPLLRACQRHVTTRAALAALGRLRVERAFPLLLAGLRENFTAAAAARGLGDLGDRKAVPALIGVLHRREVREDALAALRTLTDLDLGPDPAAWIDWWRKTPKDSRLPPGVDPSQTRAG